ncbi:4-alpha-glucanotransferase [Rosettibacter firmus]|uniref:4-alpha-glucanotransferase n=1 Tax=Rosettibacter firmus TaxID=3111522 RepID=UPI00336BFC9D
MNYSRSAGILLHPTSLPSKYGIGDFGYDAFKFIDFLVEIKQSLWQILPLGPTGYGNSPYQCFSAFAGNPLLISPDKLKEENLLHDDDLNNLPETNPSYVDYGQIINYKNTLLRKAYENFKDRTSSHDFQKFREDNNYWLEDFAFFMALKNYHNGIVWSKWDKEIAFRKKDAIKKWKEKLYDEILFHEFVQYIFFKQWKEIKDYANSKGIKIIGDVPIYIAYDSADLWANRHLFTVDEEGNLEFVAGVPPDYFSKTGQLWGNPLYKWDIMEKNKFDWWIKRFSKMLELVDIIRIDHFRGFEAYYKIPGTAPTAETGEWVKAPGEKLFNTIIKKLGDIPILAEDLGVITKEVNELRMKFNFPGMKILQFAFGKTGEKRFLPHNHEKHCVVYTGSHDNDTTSGFFKKEKEMNSDVFKHAQFYMNYYGDDMCYQLIRLAYSSVADIVIIPMQDILNLDSYARMNFPGKPDGNWTWRFTWDQINDDIKNKISKLIMLYERFPSENEYSHVVY